MSTSIEWSQNPDGTPGETWNPVRGCDEVSPGCAKCYAKVFAERFRGVARHPYEQGFDLRLVPEKLAHPLKFKKPTTFFVNSMSDLWHENVPFEYIAAVFGVMAACPDHRFITLTKREDRLAEFYEWIATTGPSRHPFGAARGVRWYAWNYPSVQDHVSPAYSVSAPPTWPWPLPNVWVGVSVENKKHGVPRIDKLRQIPAAVRVLSIEPLLEDLGELDLTGIGWVLVGGESGRGARACDVAWIKSVVDQCAAAGVPCFTKQLGAKAIEDSGRGEADIGGKGDGKPFVWGKVGPRGTVLRQYGLKDRKGGDPAEWPAGNWPRQFPEVRHG